jgi:hypothetical protein
MRFVVVIISCKKSHKYLVNILTRDCIFYLFFWRSVMFKTKGNEIGAKVDKLKVRWQQLPRTRMKICLTQ